MRAQSRDTWGRIAKIAHWLTAIFVLCAMANILYGMNMDRSQPRDYWVPMYRASIFRHEAFGMFTLATIGLRLVWRLFVQRPPYPSTMRQWEMTASSVVHGSLYLLAIVICILGWLQVSSNGAEVNIFGWTPLPRLVDKDPQLHAVIAEWHEWTSWCFIALVALHIGAALKHHFVDGDRILLNMLPSQTRS